MVIEEKLNALREEMRRDGLDAYIVFGTDPHLSEYVAPRWRDREWISGFTGSAGTVVITADEALLWTDPRYHLQAKRELKETPFFLVKDGLPDSPVFSEVLGSRLAPGRKAGAAALTVSVRYRRRLQGELSAYGAAFVTGGDLIDRIWEDRPGSPKERIYQHDVSYAGRSRGEKLVSLREEMERKEAQLQLLSSLDDIAWLLNLRGSDIAYNPLFTAYALIGPEDCRLYVGEEKVSADLAALLEEDGVSLRNYSQIFEDLSKIERGSRVLYSPAKTNCAAAESIPRGCPQVEQEDVTTLQKAKKNETEIRGIREAMRKDGVAMMRFINWCINAWRRGGEDELSAAAQLRAFRSEMPGFMGESFAPIVAFRDHGAVMHYSASEETAYPLEGEGLLLVDSGGHYLEGTTDSTRVIPLGTVGEQQRSDYTCVLKSHIALSTMSFPRGSSGMQLDAVARKPMWDFGLDYAHGTGHGVGFFLNVHEGPQKLTYRYVPAPLEPGMVNSNEPGLYREGEYGIRIENLILTKELFSTPFGTFYGFETLTACPYERQLIEPQMLSVKEREWIDAYHRWVYTLLSPELNESERRLLEEMTAPL